MKKILSIVFALCFASLAHAQSQFTNVVQLTESQYAALTNSIVQLRQSTTNIIQFLDFYQRSNPSIGATNQLRIVQVALDNIYFELSNLTSMLFWESSFNEVASSQNSDGSITTVFYYANIDDVFSVIQGNISSVNHLIHLFVDGTLSGSYDTSTYNFVQFYDLVDDYFNSAKAFLDDIDLLVYDVRDYTRNCYTMLYDIKNSINRFVSSFEFWTNINTNQIETIITLISTNGQDIIISNQTEIISNLLDHIGNSFDESKDLFEEMKDDIKSIKDYLEDSSPGGGSSGGTNDSSVVDLSYFDRWLKQWVERYFYPADSTYSLETFESYGELKLRLAYPSFGFRMASLEVPYLGLNRNQLWDNGYEMITLDYPEWGSPFLNTTAAYNSGHTNFYDITSALLTDMQSVNAQHYALFYVLATNILLSGQSEDASEVTNQFEQIDQYASRVYSFTNEFGNIVSQNVAVVENKFQQFADNCKEITDYLATIPKLPVNDYYFNLPTWEIFEEEYGGMEITLKLTDESFILVLEILHAFFLLMWWVTVLGVFFLVGRLCYKMFFALYKTFLFTSFMASE